MTYERGYPIARLGAALAVSLAGHAGVAWYAGGLLAPVRVEPGRRPPFIQARLADVVQSAAPAHPQPSARPGRAPGFTQPAPALPAQPYVPADQLDVRPLIMTHVMPEYPADIVSGARGRVVLQLFISADGALDGLQVAHAEPRGAFEQAALEAFAKARFTPGKKNGEAVPSLVLIEVTFGD
ncbi:MAG TPA: TonB family protein [Burkholderiales bacterium]|nr:TonB family protein [Burkholderiales bacterium]